MMSQDNNRMVSFILQTSWEDLPLKVQEQAVKCALDLIGALAAGAVTSTATVIQRVIGSQLPGNEATVALMSRRSSLAGAALANGFAINALDVDDGHRLIKGHPGAAVFPALLAAGEFTGISVRELLTTLVVSYEIAIRMGLAIHSHYRFYHGSGSWGSIAAAGGVSRILGLTASQLHHALGAAEYHAPLTPVMRPVRQPTMNKDGIGWGNMVGVFSALMAAEGYTGAPTVLDLPEFEEHLASLGSTYAILDLYFKPYTCCRWSHPAIDAVLGLRKHNLFHHENIARISILTFSAAASLYSGKPTTTEEAQYNVLYPVAAAAVFGEVGPRQVSEDCFRRPDVLSLMDLMTIRSDSRFDAAFPERRLCEVTIELRDGSVLRSGVQEATGEPEHPVNLSWIVDKFHWLTRDVLNRCQAEAVVTLLQDGNSCTVPRLMACLKDLNQSLLPDGLSSSSRHMPL